MEDAWCMHACSGAAACCRHWIGSYTDTPSDLINSQPARLLHNFVKASVTNAEQLTHKNKSLVAGSSRQ